jgi:hypothetical protein
MAAMTPIMQLVDSASGAPLLRYAYESLVPNPREGVSYEEQISEGLRRVIADMDIATAFRQSGYDEQPIMPECNGTLAAVGRGGAEGR